MNENEQENPLDAAAGILTGCTVAMVFWFLVGAVALAVTVAVLP